MLLNDIDRLNSNIYKNLFPELTLDMEFITKKIETTPSSFDEIHQDDHGFEINDVLYKISDNEYGKAVADNTDKSIVAGIVTHVTNKDVFTLMTVGIYDYPYFPYKDSSILYLSDKNPGRLTHYLDISNKVYVPVGIYADMKIILNIIGGAAGMEFRPYSDEAPNIEFDTYQAADLEDIIKTVFDNA